MVEKKKWTALSGILCELIIYYVNLCEARWAEAFREQPIFSTLRAQIRSRKRLRTRSRWVFCFGCDTAAASLSQGAQNRISSLKLPVVISGIKKKCLDFSFASYAVVLCCAVKWCCVASLSSNYLYSTLNSVSFSALDAADLPRQEVCLFSGQHDLAVFTWFQATRFHHFNVTCWDQFNGYLRESSSSLFY